MYSAENATSGMPRRAVPGLIRKAELALAALAIIALVGCSVTIILVRLLSQGAWSVNLVDTLSQYPSHLMLVAALLGGSLALSRGEALKIEVLNSLLSEANRHRVARLVAALGFVFYLAFLALAVRYLMIDFRLVVMVVYLPLFILIGAKLLFMALQKEK